MANPSGQTDAGSNAIDIRDGRSRNGRATVYRADIEHPNARTLSATAWHLLLLVATYCDGNPDGWRLDRAHLAARLGRDVRHVTRAAAELREAGYLQTYRRTLPKQDGRKWIVGPAKLPNGDIDVGDGLEVCPQWELRSPLGTYADGPHDLKTVIVDSTDPRPGRWRVLRVLHRWRVPDIGGAEGSNGRIRQAGATFAELIQRGLAVNGARRVVPIDQVTPAELLSVIELAELVAAGVGPVGDRVVAGLGSEAAALQWASVGVDVSIQPPAAEPPAGLDVSIQPPQVEFDPAGVDAMIQPGVDEKIQPTSDPASFQFHRPLSPPSPALLATLHRGDPVEEGRREEWRQLVGSVVGLLEYWSVREQGGSAAFWQVALADTRSPALLARIHEQLTKSKGTIGKMRRIGPYSVSEALAEVRRAWLAGVWEIPAAAVADAPSKAEAGQLAALAEAYDQAAEVDDIEAAIERIGVWQVQPEAVTLRGRAEIARLVVELRRRAAELLAAEPPERNATRAAAWQRRATAAALLGRDREIAAVAAAAGGSLDRTPWAWSTWLASGLHAV